MSEISDTTCDRPMTAIVCLGCRAIRHTRADEHGRLQPPPCKCGELGWTTLEAADRDRAGVQSCVVRRRRLSGWA